MSLSQRNKAFTSLEDVQTCTLTSFQPDVRQDFKHQEEVGKDSSHDTLTAETLSDGVM